MMAKERPTSDVVEAFENAWALLSERILALEETSHALHSVGHWRELVMRSYEFGRTFGFAELRRTIARDLTLLLNESTEQLDLNETASGDADLREKAWHDSRAKLFAEIHSMAARLQALEHTDRQTTERWQVALNEDIDKAAKAALRAGPGEPLHRRIGWALRAAAREFERVSAR